MPGRLDLKMGECLCFYLREAVAQEIGARVDSLPDPNKIHRPLTGS
jgi:hypothetical protein